MENTTTAALSVDTPSNQKIKAKRKVHFISAALVLFALLAVQMVNAAAPTSGDFLYEIYNEVVGWLTGAPGIIISIFTFGFAAFQGIMKQNYATCVGAFLIALLFANAQDAIEYFLTASVGI